MKYLPLKQILTQTRAYWDRDETRPAVRDAFRKALLCGTPALGAEVYASEKQERIVCHTCKGKGCSSCGYRATVTWQRGRWAALPNLPFKGSRPLTICRICSGEIFLDETPSLPEFFRSWPVMLFRRTRARDKVCR